MAGHGRPGRLDLDRTIDDELLLRTVPGAVDYLFEELRTFGGAEVTVVDRQRDAVQVRYRGPLRALVMVRYFDTGSICLFPEVPRRIRESTEHGVLSALTGDSPRIMFRVGDLGEQRWAVRDQLAADPDWHNSAGDWDLNVITSRDGLVAEVGELYLTQRFGPLLRAPASTNPVIGAVMIRLAKIEPGQSVLDPFCGAGTLLVLAGEMAEPGLLLGGEVQRSWALTARTNLAKRGLRATIFSGDARYLPFLNLSVDRIVANLPFGKRVGTHRHNTQLYPTALREVSRVLTRQGRAVLLTDDKRLFQETVQRTPLLRVIKEIVLERGGAHPSAYVVVKRGNSRALLGAQPAR